MILFGYKRILSYKLIALFLCLSQICYAQSEWQFECKTGFSYEISNNSNWGINEPVVTYVEPGSSAYYAGIKVNDIIMEVGCNATYLRDSVLLDQWLVKNNDTPNQMKLTIRNFDNYFSQYTIDKSCKTRGSLSEQKLAEIFASYSFENSRKEFFSMPLHITPMSIEDHDYSDFHSFDFYRDSEDLPLDVKKNIEESFLRIGIKRNTVNPDFYINVSYSFKDKVSNNGFAQDYCDNEKRRYNFSTQQMVTFPIADPGSKSLYEGKISIEFFDKKVIDSTQYTSIWKAGIKENFLKKININQYLDSYIPLILMQFPYTGASEKVQFEVNFKNYLYTGIEYDPEDLQKIAELDPYGPAYNAGIFLGFKILKINNMDLLSNWDEQLKNYDKFLEKTSLFRGKCFDANKNYPINKFWNMSDIQSIQKYFSDKKNKVVFSYLFNFDKYINPNYVGELEFEVSSSTIVKKIRVKPEIRHFNTIRVIQ